MKKIRWYHALAVVGAVMVIVGLLTEFDLAIEDPLYFGGVIALSFGLSTWSSRRRRIRNIPPPPVPVEPSEP